MARLIAGWRCEKGALLLPPLSVPVSSLQDLHRYADYALNWGRRQMRAKAEADDPAAVTALVSG